MHFLKNYIPILNFTYFYLYKVKYYISEYTSFFALQKMSNLPKYHQF